MFWYSVVEHVESGDPHKPNLQTFIVIVSAKSTWGIPFKPFLRPKRIFAILFRQPTSGVKV